MDVALFISTIKNSVSALSAIQSNEVLRERIAFIYEQMDVVLKSYESAQKELSETKEKLVELEKQIAAYREKDEFVQHMGAAFRKNPAGGYILAAYCPNCLKQVGSSFDDFPFYCPTCGWSSSFNGYDLSHIMKSLP
ncbi:Uncharacterised protein [Leminorella grimontii]|nr:hypothetical protein GLGR_1905 [Leminorella grimontii ATCC 33999 = DSM 5078]VFS60142.1 Uncharacterised protein [Leminorella grimontii]